MKQLRRVGFLYTADWAHEYLDYQRGAVPAHRLFGAAHFSDAGVVAEICPPIRRERLARHRQLWKVWQALWAAFDSSLDCVVATNEAAALPLLTLQRIGLARRPVVVLGVALLARRYRVGLGGSIRRWLMRGAAHVVVYARAQVPLVVDLLKLPPGRVSFLAFGVDVHFFNAEAASPAGEAQWDVVAVGTNEGKDFPVLVSALRQGESCLIVTDEANRELALSVPCAGEVTVMKARPIVELRTKYLEARRCVIPLRDVDYSSGQTVLLENLALGRPVVISDVPGVRDYVDLEEGIVLVPSGDVDAMRRALSADVSPHVQGAVDHVRSRFTSERFSKQLLELCATVATAPTRRVSFFPLSWRR